MTGPPGIITGIMVGFLRAVLVDESKVFDLVPADYTVNALIGVMWETVNRYQRDDRIKKKPKIYNYVSGVECPLTWGKYIKEMHVHYHKAPPFRAIWYVFSICYTNLWTGQFLRFWLHRIPAVFVDLLLRVNGQKPKMMKMYSKTENLMDLYYTFSTKEWKFDNTNTRQLWSTMNPEERVLFKFNFEEFDWLSYIKCYYYGIRKYILHEDTDNISKALAKNRKLFWLHNFCIVVLIFVVLQICWVFLSRIIC
ncbi:Hypothetical protein CINCED_3A021430 [Cinara cedri]|nr:Hypothetical protein CINCED_3A021430 [Cinara cedri]